MWVRNFFIEIKNSRGSTLLELLLVIIFLGVALVSTISVMSSSLYNSFDTEIMLTAVNLAHEKLEDIFYDKNNKGYGFVKEQNYPVENEPDGKKGFTRSVSVTDFATYKEVKVTVTHANIPDCVLVAYLTNY